MKNPKPTIPRIAPISVLPYLLSCLASRPALRENAPRMISTAPSKNNSAPRPNKVTEAAANAMISMP